jgi:soluble lytic murein transglycosylase
VPRLTRAIRKLVLAAVVFVVAATVLYHAVRWVHDRRVTWSVEAHRELIWEHAEANDLPPELVRTIVRAESSGNPRAVSSKGARGLMQIMPRTHAEVCRRRGFPEGNLFDPDHNLRVGTAYLRMLLDRFAGDVRLAVAAYHMGPTRLDRLRRAHPKLGPKALIARHAPASTRHYVRKVLGDRSPVLPPRGNR